VTTPLKANISSPKEVFATFGTDLQATGKNNISQIHEYIAWNGNSALTVWNSSAANRVHGNDGLSFMPGITANDTVVTFVDLIFRTANLFVNYSQNSGSVDLYGINCLWFVENISDYASGPGYYDDGPPGMFNMSMAEQGTPLFVSKPHFLDADPYYISMVDGLSPNRTLHDNDLYIEPNTGIMMGVLNRGQVNVVVNSSLLYPDMLAAYVPVAWLEQGGFISSELAEQFRNQVYLAQTVADGIRWTGMLGGGLLLLLALMIFLAVLAPDRNPLPGAPTPSEADALLAGRVTLN